jgi:hypothetical protein
VRLNAAVRLAYLGSADGVGELITGLSSGGWAVRFHQVPEALALIGDVGGAELRALCARPGPSRVAAARALLLRGERTGVIEAIGSGLESADTVEQWMAAMLAGEVGGYAAGIAEDLVEVLGAWSGQLVVPLSALTSVAGERALPTLEVWLDHEKADVRHRALRAVCGLGPAAASLAPRLVDTLRRRELPVNERLAAAHTLTRVAGSAGQLLLALSDDDRRVRIGILRELAQLCPRFSNADPLGHYPRWEAPLLYRRPVDIGDEGRMQVADALSQRLGDGDLDVVRNAAIGLALCNPSKRLIDALRAAASVPERLRQEVLVRLGDATESPPYEPDALALSDPPADYDAIAAECELLWARADGGELKYSIPVPKWQFLQYLVDRYGVQLHGSRTAGIDVLKPVSRSGGGNRTSDQPGVFAVDHAIMAMYFGIIDRSRVPNLSNAIFTYTHSDGTTRRYYNLATEWLSLSARPFIDATVYVLPADTFTFMGEWTSLVPVKPLARLSVTPEDFPLLEYLFGSDLGPLANEFGEQNPYLRHVGIWATTRSDRSAHTIDHWTDATS